VLLIYDLHPASHWLSFSTAVDIKDIWCDSSASYKFKGFYKSFFLAWFSTIVDYHILTENYFSYHLTEPCVLSFVLTV